MTEHSPTCALGARAENRGPCDCGAIDNRPFRIRLLDDLEPPGRGVRHRLVEVVVDGPLTTGHAVELSLQLQELTREEGQRAAAQRARRRP